MSTTFGLRGYTSEGIHTVEIAKRTGIGKGKIVVSWINQDIELFCSYLPDACEIEALDNTHQGIQTIGDLRRAIAESHTKDPMIDHEDHY